MRATGPATTPVLTPIPVSRSATRGGGIVVVDLEKVR